MPDNFKRVPIVSLTNSAIIRAAPVVMYALTGYNNGPEQYVQLWNRITAPSPGHAGAAGLTAAMWVGASRNFSMDIRDPGHYFDTGLVVSNSLLPDSYSRGGNDCQFFLEVSL